MTGFRNELARVALLMDALNWWAKLTKPEHEHIADHCGFKRNTFGQWPSNEIKHAYKSGEGMEALSLLREMMED